jgi:hypothetical protein
MLPIYVSIAMSGDQVHLRNQARQVSDQDVKSMLTKHGFFDRTWNKTGAFANDFVDNGDGTVTDRATGLMWQKDGSSEGMMWANVKNYITKLNRDRFAGYSDWRLPTVEEIASLMQSSRSKENLYIDTVFSQKQDYCWAADTFGPDIAWYASFKAGMIRHIYHFFYYVRATRTIQ